jgi:pimeloyl-ACP methyl ester carboxylesterase
MLPFRVTLRGASNFRAFSTSRVLRSDLSFQVFGPEKEEPSGNPIVFLHGLFGSKQNNRSISKYVDSRLVIPSTPADKDY